MFEALTDSGTFVSWARGRIAPVDRFLSNFHKPLQRRMLFSDPTQAFPSTGVIRCKATGEIFLIGESREDAKNDKAFDRLTVLHVVSNTSSGTAEYFNYRNDLADPLNGDIAKTSEGEFYIALEYVSTKSSEAGDEAYQGKFMMYGPENMPLQRDGVFSLLGKSYKVVQAYKDSGFTCGILLEQEDDMLSIVYHAVDEGTSGYDVASGTITLNTVDYTFAGTVDHIRQNEQGHKFLDVFLKHTPLPVKISTGDSLTLPEQGKVKIVTIITDVNSQGQIHLACQGA